MGKFLIGNADRYEIFFGVLAFVFFALFASVMKIVILNGNGGGYIFPFVTLFGILIMAGLTKIELTAKSVFWSWIGLTVGLTALAFVGDFLIWMVR